MNFCANCGPASGPQGGRFCSSCGTALSTDARPALPNTAHEEITARGHNGQITLLADRVRISRPKASILTVHAFKGDKDIFIASITSLQFKAPGRFTAGYLQVGYSGSQESKGALFDAAKDENTVMFRQDKMAEFEKLKAAIEARMANGQSTGGQSAPVLSVADELTKLASLRDRGVLSSEEFQQQKLRLLGR